VVFVVVRNDGEGRKNEGRIIGRRGGRRCRVWGDRRGGGGVVKRGQVSEIGGGNMGDLQSTSY
jgi:hypothetical protein